MRRIITFLLISSSSSFNLHLTRFNSRINVVKRENGLKLRSSGDNKEENKEEFDNYDINNIMTKLDELQRTCNEMVKRINYLENENKKRVNTTGNIRDNTRTSISSSRSSTTTNTPAVTPSSFDQARRNLEDTWRIFQVMETDDEEGCDISNLEDLSEAAGCSNVKCEGVRSFRGRGGGEEGKGGAREIARQLRPNKSQFLPPKLPPLLTSHPSLTPPPPQCNGSGSCPCRFCNGTGLFTIGDEVFYTAEGGGVVGGSSVGRGGTPGMGNAERCRICKDGYEECIQCKGAGWKAGWRV